MKICPAALLECTVSCIILTLELTREGVLTCRHDMLEGYMACCSATPAWSDNVAWNPGVGEVACCPKYCHSLLYVHHTFIFVKSKPGVARIELATPGLQDQCSSHWAMEALTTLQVCAIYKVIAIKSVTPWSCWPAAAQWLCALQILKSYNGSISTRGENVKHTGGKCQCTASRIFAVPTMFIPRFSDVFGNISLGHSSSCSQGQNTSQMINRFFNEAPVLWQSSKTSACFVNMFTRFVLENSSFELRDFPGTQRKPKRFLTSWWSQKLSTHLRSDFIGAETQDPNFGNIFPPCGARGCLNCY